MRGRVWQSCEGAAAMPPQPRKKLGYNWKARQSSKDKPTNRDLATGRRDGTTHVQDTNTLVLPTRSIKPLTESEEKAPKRKKLSSKRRKRLMKILEVKEKKKKREEMLSKLSVLSLPPNQMACLLPSTSLSSAPKESAKWPLIEGGGGDGGGREVVRRWKLRRKQRKRRELRVEKIAREPRQRVAEREDSSDPDEEEEEEESGEGVGESGEGVEEGVEESGEVGGSDGDGGEVDGSDGDGVEVDGRSDEVDTASEEPLAGEELVSMESGSLMKRAAVFRQLSRLAEVQEWRRQLPVVGEEARVMEAVREAPVTVLCGETGSGKTTQLPQFLYEYGYTLSSGPCGGGVIGITEPRRVAAVSMAGRVAYEMGLTERQVSYQIRYENTVTDETVIKFMTDGVLLREIEQDFLLGGYSVVVVDEAHERSVFTDILLGLLSRIVPLREKSGRPLKLIVMSATLRVDDFRCNSNLFPSPPPVLSVESRQFPVTVHFNKRTPVEYVRESYVKVCKIHRQLPTGHVLVFVTGRAEVLRLCRLLRSTFPSHCTDQPLEYRGGRRRRRRGRGGDVDLDKYPVLPPPTWEEEEMEGEEEGEEEEEDGGGELVAEVSAHDQQLPMLVLPLFSLLSSDRQAEVFRPVAEGVRLCVVATNIAETSITIPNIKYVVDTGKVKRRYYDKVTGISTFRVDWISRASADQRAGRAGRTGPGHCYRLYSSAVFQNQFDKFSEPEICRRPVEDLVLQMKALGIQTVSNFPFPTPPSPEALEAAERGLQGLGALSSEGALTALGRTMAQFPVAPRYAKMLSLGHQHGCLPYVITIVAALSVKELFVGSEVTASSEGGPQMRGLASLKRALAGKGEYSGLGDIGILLRAVGAWDHAGGSEGFSRRCGLRPQAMREVARLRQQLTSIVNSVCADLDLVIDPKLAPPTPDQARLLRQIILSGLGDRVARKLETGQMTLEDKKRLRLSYQSVSCEGPVYFHPSSSSSFTSSPPHYVVYQELMDTASEKIFMRCVAAVEEAWLPLITPQFCTFSDPLEFPPPNFDPDTGTVRCHVTCAYGPHKWPLPPLERDHPPGLRHYRLFAMFLLQGKVCPQLAQFSPALLLPPVTMVKTWANLHSQTDVLLKALVEKEIFSRQALHHQWNTTPKYLLKAFSLWLPQSRHSALAAIWPPL